MIAIATPWDALMRSTRPAAQFNRCADTPAPPPTTKAARVRELLRQNGPMSAAAICLEVEYPNTGLVSASLKHDIAIGRISCSDGLYSINPEYDAELHRRIALAKALLRRYGYTVEQP